MPFGWSWIIEMSINYIKKRKQNLWLRSFIRQIGFMDYNRLGSDLGDLDLHLSGSIQELKKSIYK